MNHLPSPLLSLNYFMRVGLKEYGNVIAHILIYIFPNMLFVLLTEFLILSLKDIEGDDLVPVFLIAL